MFLAWSHAWRGLLWAMYAYIQLHGARNKSSKACTRPLLILAQTDALLQSEKGESGGREHPVSLPPFQGSAGKVWATLKFYNLLVITSCGLKGFVSHQLEFRARKFQEKRKRKDMLMTAMDRMHTCSIVCRLCKASRSNKNEEHALTSKTNTRGCTYLSHILIFQCRTTLKALGFSKNECGSNSSSWAENNHRWLQRADRKLSDEQIQSINTWISRLYSVLS